MVLQAAKVIYGGFENWEVRGIRNLRLGVPLGGLTVEVVTVSDEGEVLRLEGVWDGTLWTDTLITESREDAAKKGGKGKRKGRTEKPKCTKGRVCGMTCIRRYKANGEPTGCRFDPPPVVAEALNQAAAAGQGGGGAVPTSLPQDHVVTTSKRITSASIDNSLNAINTPGAADRIGMFRAFVEKTGVQSIWADVSASSNDIVNVARQSLNDQSFGLIVRFEDWTTPLNGAVGYTGRLVNHVVIGTNSIARNGEFKAASAQLNEAVDRVLRGSDDDYILDPMLHSVNSRMLHNDSREFTTYLHEMGHQVHFKAGSPNPPADIAGSVTDYGATNEDEWFAEHFTMWMLDANKYANADPVGAQFIEESLRRAIESPLTVQEIKEQFLGI